VGVLLLLLRYSVHDEQDICHGLIVQASVTEREKELLAAAEKKASEEVATLSERVHRLQVLFSFKVLYHYHCSIFIFNSVKMLSICGSFLSQCTDHFILN